MKSTNVSFQSAGVSVQLADEVDDWYRNSRGWHSVRVALPDGREFRFVDASGATFQDVVILDQRDDVFKATHAFIPATGCISATTDVYEVDEPEFPDRETALGYGMERAIELGVPLVEVTWPGETGGPPAYTSLFQPTQVIVRDRLGEMVFTLCGETLESACDGTTDEAQRVSEIDVTEGMTPAVLVGLVREAWAASCEVIVRPIPILNSDVKAVQA